jgi:hypothetical protein
VFQSRRALARSARFANQRRHRSRALAELVCHHQWAIANTQTTINIPMARKMASPAMAMGVMAGSLDQDGP